MKQLVHGRTDAEKKNDEPQGEQSKRFLKAVAYLEAAGELNPTEADEKFERAVGRVISSPAPKEPH